jgi:predicted PurR-regulated permease PerM
MPPHGSAQEQPDLIRITASGIIAALVIAALYFGRPLLVPFALAILMAFALSPMAERLQRLGLPRSFCVILTVAVTVGIIGSFGLFVGTQVQSLISEVPTYQSNLMSKVKSLRGVTADSKLVRQTSKLFQSINKAIAEQPKIIVPSTLPGGAEVKIQKPIPVEIRVPDPAPFEVLKSIVTPLLEPLALFFLSIIFVVFILLYKEDLRDRFISLTGRRDLQRTTLAIDDGAERLSHFLLLQASLNAFVGFVIAMGLWFLDIPNAGLWGLIAAVLRFIPYIGIPAAAAIPVLLALAVAPGWSLVLSTIAFYFVVETIAGQAIEPWLYGRNMGLSPVAVLLSASFWTWIWGPVGLLLSTPLTMCLVVLGRHVEHLRFLDTLLGDRPPLSAEENFYLDMLNGNADELTHHAETVLKEKSLVDYFDDVAIPGLALAQADINRQAFSDEEREKILLTVEGLLANLAEHSEVAPPAKDKSSKDKSSKDQSSKEVGKETEQPPQAAAAVTELPTRFPSEPVLCIAGRGPLDQIAASLLAHVLERRGLKAIVLAPEQVSFNHIQELDTANAKVICLSYLEPLSPANARLLVRRLRKQMPEAVIIAGIWSALPDDSFYSDWAEETGSDHVANDLDAALQKIISLYAISGAEPRKNLERPRPAVITTSGQAVPSA